MPKRSKISPRTDITDPGVSRHTSSVLQSRPRSRTRRSYSSTVLPRSPKRATRPQHLRSSTTSNVRSNSTTICTRPGPSCSAASGGWPRPEFRTSGRSGSPTPNRKGASSSSDWLNSIPNRPGYGSVKAALRHECLGTVACGSLWSSIGLPGWGGVGQSTPVSIPSGSIGESLMPRVSRLRLEPEPMSTGFRPASRLAR